MGRVGGTSREDSDENIAQSPPRVVVINSASCLGHLAQPVNRSRLIALGYLTRLNELFNHVLSLPSQIFAQCAEAEADRRYKLLISNILFLAWDRLPVLLLWQILCL